ncbi:MAG: ArsR/SmtB family transcription factor [Bacillota bacterium]
MATFSVKPEELKNTAEILKALAHPVRLCLVVGLARCGGCAVREIQECLALPQATVSQHLAKLRAAGLVAARRKGKEVHYEVSSPLARRIAELVWESAEKAEKG